jgi:hypothetical protein
MGFSAYQAIEAATRINAQWIGILVRKNPLKNLRHLQKLNGIMVHGQWLTRSDLKQRLSELENGLN